MKRIILVLAVLVAGAIGAAPAVASAPSCSVKTNTITSWSVANNDINGHAETHCGGAQPGNQGDYFVRYDVEFLYSTTWEVPNCQNGQACLSVKPASGLFTGGQDHNWNWGFSPTTIIACHDWRTHTEVVFPNYQPDPGYAIKWNGAQFHIGGC